MALVEFKVDDVGLKQLQRILNPKQLKSALYNAVSRTTKAARQIAAKAVMERLSIPRKYIDSPTHRDSAIRVKIFKGDAPYGVLNVREKRLPLIAFKALDTKKLGVNVLVDVKQPPITLRHAFIVTVASKAQIEQGTGHKGVFLRAKRGEDRTPEGFAQRLPIEERFGPKVVDFITRDEIRTRVEAEIGNRLAREIDGQIKRFTEGRFSSLSQAVQVLDENENANA